MNREEQIESYEEIQDYLQSNNVYGLFSQLLQQVMLQKPSNLLDFLIAQLQQPQKLTLFVVGPPGLSINSIIQKALASSNKPYQVFNFGEEVKTIHKLLEDEDKDKYKSCKLVRDQSVTAIVDKIQKHAKSDKNYIIEGYPKKLSQALALQKRGVYAKNVLIINVGPESLQQLCLQKIESLNAELGGQQKLKLVEEAMLEHYIYIGQIKKFYKKYMQIDLSSNREEQFIIKQLNKAFTLKTLQPSPRVSTQIIIVGAPFSGRTTLGKMIADRYKLVYISTSFLLAEEIRKDTIHGRKIKTQYINNQLIDSFLIEKLIEERITKKDCRMQGFVLEGYPKTKEQLQNMRNLKLQLTMIVGIDAPKELSQRRCNIPIQKLNARYEKWLAVKEYLKESKESIFWVDPALSSSSACEEVTHQLEKQFI